MPDRGYARLSAILFTLLYPAVFLTLAPGQAAAQDERWYRVELMVFKHLPGDHSETFEATPQLAYPGAFRFLVDPDLVDANRARYPGRDYLTDNGRQVFEWEEAPATAPLEQPTNSPALTAAFRIEPGSTQEFRGKAAYMQRSGRYEILFHETWAQPVASERDALPIILDRSGDSDTWPELQGSVKLYLSRYLHLETDLWLNTRGAYLGDNDWQMPAPPRAPQSLVVEAAPEAPPQEPAPGLSGEESPLFDEAAGTALEEESVEEAIDEGALYPWRHAVALRQKRRMRSEEIHYIDHPLLGVVARLMPLSEEEVEALTTLPESQAREALAGGATPVAQ